REYWCARGKLRPILAKALELVPGDVHIDGDDPRDYAKLPEHPAERTNASFPDRAEIHFIPRLNIDLVNKPRLESAEASMANDAFPYLFRLPIDIRLRVRSLAL